MLRIKRPLMVVAVALILFFVLYDYVNSPKDSVYIGKTIVLTGRVTGIKKYDVPFGERKFKLQIKDGPKELPAFFVKIKESRLLKGCNIQRGDSEEYIKQIEKRLYGSLIKCIGQLENFEIPANPGQFNSKAHYNNEGFYGILNAKELSIKEKPSVFLPDTCLHRLNLAISEKYQKILGSKDAGSLSAMVLGDKSNLNEEIKELYQENSISHLLAISGLHISLVGGAVYLFLKKMKISFNFPLIWAGIILVLYGAFTGFSVSTTRAVIMMCVFFFSFLIGKSYDLQSSLAFAAILIMLINHRAIYQSGFQLSFLAVIGIFYIMPELMYIFKIQNINKKGANKAIYIFFSSVVCSVSITIATLPVILINFYELSLTGIILNIIVIPLMSIVVITGLIGGFVALLTEIAGSFILGISYYILNFYTFLCKICDNLVSLRLIIGKPEKWQVILYYTVVMAVIYILSKKRRAERIEELKCIGCRKLNLSKRIIITVFFIGFGFFILAFKNDKFSLNMLDIGQGDCFVVNDGNNDIYISDCGSTTVQNVGKTRLLPFLKSKGWGKVDTIFISHMDKDHVNGVNDLLKCAEITIGRIIISASYKSDKLNCAELEELKELAKMRDIKLFYMKKGDEIVGKDISFRCIYPTGEEDIKDQNEASIVMRMDYKGLSMLFTGDIAGSTEEKIIEDSDEDILDCDILKVCHHGSKNSSTDDFLKKVSPKLYLISCGLMNRYGHPHRDALSRMTEEGGRILRTDHMGGTQIKLADGKLIITKAGKNLTGKRFSPAASCDCEDCERIKVNTHLVKP